ncbi:MAG: hypothetical protein EP330_24195 [Deltaproteobacteria bacterium]|nr:MAG: hypothetical protein EP330_24195 [Deltaproteobacteria bacterium]
MDLGQRRAESRTCGKMEAMLRSLPLLLLAACGGPPVAPFETTRAEEWRPQLHFSPTSGWLNDPVGLVRFDGVYHLFFQHYPDDTVWGPMHWGHATSADLLHWEEQPIALSPDPALGTVFSGSAIVLEDGLTGVCASRCIALMFTHNGGDSGDQKQSLATSLDGVAFTVHPASPVIANPGIRDFRDPRVYLRDDGRYGALISEGDAVGLWVSDDLLAWTREGGMPIDSDGVVETPDVVHFGDTSTLSTGLAIAVNPGGPAGGSGQGWLDGGPEPSATARSLAWMDHGPDFYAFQAWADPAATEAPGAAPSVGLAWAMNWRYALRTPTEPWRGAMSLPRRLGAAEGQLAQHAIALDALVRGTPVDLASASPRRVEQALESFEGEVYRLRLASGEATHCDLGLRESEDAGTRITWDGDTLSVDRSFSGEVDFDDSFAAVHTAPLSTAGLDLEVVVDTSMLEIFAGDGQVVFTERIFPPYDATGISVSCDAEVDLRIDLLHSIWR